jgi:outer membrane lipoprotein LolB
MTGAWRLTRACLGLAATLVLSACATLRPASERGATPPAWDVRLATLQHAAQWSLDGRAAASVDRQGWQASLSWRQLDTTAELHLAGPLGVGATSLRFGPQGLSVDGTAPRDDIGEALQARLGVALPLASLRYWLLGVPDPGSDAVVTRNDADRASRMVQAGWTIDIGRYMAVAGDSLPAQLSLQRDAVRVKLAIDRWEFPR